MFFTTNLYSSEDYSSAFNYKLNIKALRALRGKEFREWRELKKKIPFFRPKILKRKGGAIFTKTSPILPKPSSEDQSTSTPKISTYSTLYKGFFYKNPHNPFRRSRIDFYPHSSTSTLTDSTPTHLKSVLPFKSNLYSSFFLKKNFFKQPHTPPMGQKLFLRENTIIKLAQLRALKLNNSRIKLFNTAYSGPLTQLFKRGYNYSLIRLNPNYKKYQGVEYFQSKRYHRSILWGRQIKPLAKSNYTNYLLWYSSREELSIKFFQKTFLTKSLNLNRKKYPHQAKPWLLNALEDFYGKVSERRRVRPYIPFDEKGLSHSLKEFSRLTPNKYPLTRFYFDRIRFWETIDPLSMGSSTQLSNLISSRTFKPNPSMHPLFFIKKFFIKSKLMTHPTSLYKGVISPKNQAVTINYPRLRKPITLTNYPFVVQPNLDRVIDNLQVKTSFNSKPIQTNYLKSPLMPLHFLLNIGLNSHIFLHKEFSYLFDTHIYYTFFSSLYLSFPLNSYRLLTKNQLLNLPLAFIFINNKKSFLMNFFNYNRVAQHPYLGNFLQKVPLIPVNPPLLNYLPTDKLKILPKFINNHFSYSLFLKNLRNNPIRRPLYSTFFYSPSVHTKHSFRLISSKGMTSLLKYPVSTTKRFIYNTDSSNLGSLFQSQNNDNLSEINYNTILQNYLSNSFKGFCINNLRGVFNKAITNFPYPLSNNLPLQEPLNEHGNTLLKHTLRNRFGYKDIRNLLTQGNINLFFNNLVLYKFFFWNLQKLAPKGSKINDFLWTSILYNFNNKLTFSSKTSYLESTNIIPVNFFKFSIKKKIVKTLSNDVYVPRSTVYFYRTLIHFVEFFTGKKVFLKLNPFLEGSLSFKDTCRCSLWYSKINTFQRILGHRIFVHESLRIFMAAVRFRDPTFLANWIKAMLYRMSFWKYRVLFRYIKYVFRALFAPCFSELDFKGVRLTVRGKISVAGNARTRTLAFSVGNTSHSELNNRVLSNFSTIESFTGVMGFRLSFYF